MNTLLENLCHEFDVSEKTFHEIMQVYTLLDDNGKQRVLQNFPTLIKKIEYIEQDSITQQEILLDNTMTKIQNIGQ